MLFSFILLVLGDVVPPDDPRRHRIFAEKCVELHEKFPLRSWARDLAYLLKIHAARA